MAAGFVPHYVFLLHHLCNRFVLKCELNLPSVDVSSLPQVLNVPHHLKIFRWTQMFSTNSKSKLVSQFAARMVAKSRGMGGSPSPGCFQILTNHICKCWLSSGGSRGERRALLWEARSEPATHTMNVRFAVNENCCIFHKHALNARFVFYENCYINNEWKNWRI